MTETAGTGLLESEIVYEDLVELLERGARRWPSQTFLEDASSSYSYADVATEMARFAERFRALGVRSGDRVTIVSENSAEVLLAAFAALKLRAIFTFLHPNITVEGLRRLMPVIEPAVVVAPAGDVLAVAKDFGAAAVALGDDGGRSISHSELGTDAQWPTVFSDDTAFLVFTSGSTGVPRGVIVSHDNAAFATSAIFERLRYRSSDRVALTLPLAFDYGLYQVFVVAHAGATLRIATTAMSGPPLLAFLDREKITVLPLVPGQVASLLKLLERRPRDLSALRMITNTGEHLPAADVEMLERLLPNVEVFAMYGLTECKRVAIRLPEEAKSAPDSVGKPLAGTEVAVITDDGVRATANATGELVVSGRHVTQGYWRAPSDTASRFRIHEGRRELATGDICRLDEDGRIYVLGRRDSIIKHRGVRMSLLELERAAVEVAGVVEAAAVKTSDDALHLFVSGTLDLDVAEVAAQLEKYLEWNKLPDGVHVLADFPRASTGKVDRTALVARVQGDEPRG